MLLDEQNNEILKFIIKGAYYCGLKTLGEAVDNELAHLTNCYAYEDIPKIEKQIASLLQNIYEVVEKEAYTVDKRDKVLNLSSDWKVWLYTLDEVNEMFCLNIDFKKIDKELENL
jgi:hypothetical protein